MAFHPRDADMDAVQLQKAIDGLYGFAHWQHTAEGHDFWWDVAQKLEWYQDQLPKPAVTAERNAAKTGEQHED